MTLSARDRQIIAAIEHGVQVADPRWAHRFARRHRRFVSRERREDHPGRRLFAVGALCLCWFVLMCVALAHRAPWIWIGLAVTGAVLAAAAVRLAVRARRYGLRFALRRRDRLG